MSIASDPSDLHRSVEVTGYDEMIADDGDLRDHWRYVIGSIRMLGRADLRDRHDEVTRLLRQDGAAHDAGSAGRSVRGPGPLDLIPMLVSSDDWGDIESGLVQRAELLDLVLDDLYGPQELIHRGIVPVEVVHRHPGYIRAVHGDSSLGEHRLVHYSADVARARSGAFVVLADRTRTPSGSGDALENRLVLSRVFPSLFRDAHVHRLAHYFRGVRRGLGAISPPGRDDPRIVILTPGPEHPGYFEHSYLASYLGYPLVEPSDLTVRRGRVWLRSLEGLQQVDVIVRGIGDELCDPLELQPGIGRGVPGLVEAARRGTVALANPIGAAAAENPGLLPFLPAAAEHLLGASLLLESVDTRWCGRDHDLADVLDQLDDLVVVPIDRSAVPIVGATLTDDARTSVVERIRSDPHRWVAQRLPAGGWAPSLVGDQIESRPCAIRTFLTARDGSYVAMPGGQARMPAPGAPIRVPHPADPPDLVWSKDLWVLASEPERAGTSLLSETGSGSTIGTGPLVQPSPPTIAGSLPSRAAENLFWLGRHSERAEQSIRWARTALARVSDAADQGDASTPSWLIDLVAALLAVTRVNDPVGSRADPSWADPTITVLDAVFPDDQRGLVGTISRMSQASSTVRDLLSGDTWQVIDLLEDEIGRVMRNPPSTASGSQRVLARLLTSLFALNGLSAESTVRDPVWLFLDAGQRLERAQLLVATSRATLVPDRDPDSDALVHESVLVANDSLITYRRRYRSRLQIGTLLELLLGDPSNPRSLIYQVDRLAEHASNLPSGDATGTPTEVVQRVADIAELLRGADLSTVAYRVEDGTRVALDELLGDTAVLLTRLGDALGRHFLHVEAPRALDQIGEESW